MAGKLLTGTFESTLDDKGRVVIPASLRDHYKGELVITQGQDFCVWIMTSFAYEKFLKYIESSASSLSYDEYNAIQYQHIAPAQLTEIDEKNGRVSLPSAIRSYASLSKECLILSINGYLEIWNADAYRAHSTEMQIKAREVARKLGPFRNTPVEGNN